MIKSPNSPDYEQLEQSINYGFHFNSVWFDLVSFCSVGLSCITGWSVTEIIALEHISAYKFIMSASLQYSAVLLVCRTFWNVAWKQFKLYWFNSALRHITPSLKVCYKQFNDISSCYVNILCFHISETEFYFPNNIWSLYSSCKKIHIVRTFQWFYCRKLDFA